MKLTRFLFSQFSYGGTCLLGVFITSALPELVAAMPGNLELGAVATNAIAPVAWIFRAALAIWFVQFSLRFYFGLRSGELLIEETRRGSRY